MINIVRVDDKLLHGQVAFSWVRNLKIHTIVIADDHIAYDEFMKMTLGLSKPSGVNLKILEIKEAVAFLKEQRTSELHVMAIVNSIENAYRILQQLPWITTLNIGSLRERYDAQLIGENVALNTEEVALCKKLIKEGKQLEMRMRYDDPMVELRALLKS